LRVSLNFQGNTENLLEGQMLQNLWSSLPYWAPEILTRKSYDGFHHEGLSNDHGSAILRKQQTPEKEILPKVVKVMCNIGYTCKQGTMHSKWNSVDSQSGNKVPEEDSMITNSIKPTTGDNTFNMNSLDRLSAKKFQKIHWLQHHQPRYRVQCINVNSVDSLSDNKVQEDSLTSNTINPLQGTMHSTPMDVTINNQASVEISYENTCFLITPNPTNPTLNEFTGTSEVQSDNFGSINQTVDDGLNLIKPSLVKSQVAVLQCFVWQGWDGPCATGACIDVGCNKEEGEHSIPKSSFTWRNTNLIQMEVELPAGFEEVSCNVSEDQLQPPPSSWVLQAN
ncbi:hypothetical protein U0070_015174, partial [Myodes glareolus]